MRSLPAPPMKSPRPGPLSDQLQENDNLFVADPPAEPHCGGDPQFPAMEDYPSTSSSARASANSIRWTCPNSPLRRHHTLRPADAPLRDRSASRCGWSSIRRRSWPHRSPQRRHPGHRYPPEGAGRSPPGPWHAPARQPDAPAGGDFAQDQANRRQHERGGEPPQTPWRWTTGA
jgi:hypothetical protein